MRFTVAATGTEFVIPEKWWEEAGMRGFALAALTYRYKAHPEEPVHLVSLDDIEPPLRDPGIAGLRRDRTVRILKGFVAGDAIDSVPIDAPPGQRAFAHRVRDGYHRYYCSIAAGYTHLPCIVLPYFDIRDPNC
jgi:hypothetical protein